MTRITRRQVVRGIAGLLVGYLAALITITSMDRFDDAPDTNNRIPIGSSMIGEYCELTEGMVSVLTGADPHAWQCVGAPNGAFRDVAVDFQRLCEWKFGRRARAVLARPDDVLGWACAVR